MVVNKVSSKGPGLFLIKSAIFLRAGHFISDCSRIEERTAVECLTARVWCSSALLSIAVLLLCEFRASRSTNHFRNRLPSRLRISLLFLSPGLFSGLYQEFCVELPESPKATDRSFAHFF